MAYYDQKRLAVIGKKYKGIVKYNSKTGKAEYRFDCDGVTVSISGTVRFVTGILYFSPNKWAKNYKKWFEFDRTRESYNGIKDDESYEATRQEIILGWNLAA